jgi:hypothetical protein
VYDFAAKIDVRGAEDCESHKSCMQEPCRLKSIGRAQCLIVTSEVHRLVRIEAAFAEKCK